MQSPDGPEERTAFHEEHYERDLDDADVAEQLADEEPDDEYFERAAERADLDKQSLDQDLRDAGRGHLVRP